jgi:hypothetical protein
MNSLRLLNLLTVLALCVAPARSAIFVYQFTATVDSVADAQGVFPGGFGIGAALTGSFSWDTEASVLADFGEEVNYQDPANNVAALSVSGSGITIDDPGSVSTANRRFAVANPSFGSDHFDRTADLNHVMFTGFLGTPDFSLGADFLMVLFAKEDQDPFSSTAIPNGLDPAQFDLAGGSFLQFLASGAGGDSVFTADITSFTLVPEPGQTALLFAALCGLALAMRRRLNAARPLVRP